MKYYALQCLECGERFMAGSLEHGWCPKCGSHSIKVLFESGRGAEVLAFLKGEGSG